MASAYGGNDSLAISELLRPRNGRIISGRALEAHHGQEFATQKESAERGFREGASLHGKKSDVKTVCDRSLRRWTLRCFQGLARARDASNRATSDSGMDRQSRS